MSENGGFADVPNRNTARAYLTRTIEDLVDLTFLNRLLGGFSSSYSFVEAVVMLRVCKIDNHGISWRDFRCQAQLGSPTKFGMFYVSRQSCLINPTNLSLDEPDTVEWHAGAFICSHSPPQ